MTDNDVELLELAAKAASLDFQYSDDGRIFISGVPGIGLKQWNPLTHDGDAFRLAVKLQLLVSIDAKYTRVTDGRGKFAREDHPASNACAATRRAIVRAAAEIGKSI
jgi:hypothetical protein